MKRFISLWSKLTPETISKVKVNLDTPALCVLLQLVSECVLCQMCCFIFLHTYTDAHKQTHRRYQTYYLPCFAVDKNLKCAKEKSHPIFKTALHLKAEDLNPNLLGAFQLIRIGD